MSTADKIIWHLASSSGSGPKCGRQLSRPALTTANQASMQLTTDLAEVRCRHCLRAVGLLAPVIYRARGSENEETEAEREIERGLIELTQDEDEEEDELA